MSLRVERLLLHRRISPKLDSSSILSRKLGALSEQAGTLQKVLAITNEVDIFSAPLVLVLSQI